MKPKYSELEIERRWLVDETLLPELDSFPMRLITDKYLDNSRLRLRKVEYRGELLYKLCKKYGKTSEISEPITNLYLSREEYHALAHIPGQELIRERYSYSCQGVDFSINVIVGKKAPVVVEAEFESEADAYECEPPPFCTQEVSSDSSYEAVRFATYRTEN